MQRLGHPSCEGGYSTATHLHFARKYDGEWIPADGSCPLVLSGWQAHASVPYEGTMTRGEEVRTACECREDEINGLIAEYRPATPPVLNAATRPRQPCTLLDTASFDTLLRSSRQPFMVVILHVRSINPRIAC